MNTKKTSKASPAGTGALLPNRVGPQPSEPSIYLMVGGVAGALGVALLLLMVFAAPLLGQWGLVGNLWFVLLIALGLCAGVMTFALFKSRATYTRKVLGGELVIGGPVVVMFAVVMLGFWLVPAPTMPFDVTVFLKSEAGASVQQLAHRGRITLEVGNDRKTEPVGEKGESRFVGIPSNFRGRSAVASLDSERYELVDGSVRVLLTGEPTTLMIRAKQLSVSGYVFDDNARPLAGARVSLAGRSATTDRDGRFDMKAAADLSEGDKFVVITADGHAPYRASVAPGSGTMQIKLSK
jgi:hypothetical protein